MAITPYKEVWMERKEREPFDFKKWKSFGTSNVAELRKRLEDMNLVGKVISDIRFTSHVYNMTPEQIEESLWMTTVGYPSDLHEYISEIDNADDNFPMPLYLRMDEPVLIKFQDGSQFEILADFDDTFIISMNQIPWNAAGRVSEENIEGSVLFDICKGAEIIKAEVVSRKIDEETEIADGILLSWNAERRTFGMWFEIIYFDYMGVSLVNAFDRCVLSTPLIRIKQSMYIPPWEAKRAETETNT